MFLIVSKNDDTYIVLDQAEFGPELNEKTAALNEAGTAYQVFMAKHWADLSSEALSEARRRLATLGIEYTFFDDLIHRVALELAEFRLRYTNGEPIDPSVAAQGIGWSYDPNQPLCRECGFTEGQHQLPGFGCTQYVDPTLEKTTA